MRSVACPQPASGRVQRNQHGRQKMITIVSGVHVAASSSEIKLKRVASRVVPCCRRGRRPRWRLLISLILGFDNFEISFYNLGAVPTLRRSPGARCATHRARALCAHHSGQPRRLRSPVHPLPPAAHRPPSPRRVGGVTLPHIGTAGLNLRLYYPGKGPIMPFNVALGRAGKAVDFVTSR
jgi:hypothetical protein